MRENLFSLFSVEPPVSIGTPHGGNSHASNLNSLSQCHSPLGLLTFRFIGEILARRA